MTYEELYGEPLPDGWEIKGDVFKSYGKQGVRGASLRLQVSAVTPFLGRISLEVYSPRLSINRRLEKHFKNPFKPTEEESILFEIEHGFRYPFQ